MGLTRFRNIVDGTCEIGIRLRHFYFPSSIRSVGSTSFSVDRKGRETKSHLVPWENVAPPAFHASIQRKELRMNLLSIEKLAHIVLPTDLFYLTFLNVNISAVPRKKLYQIFERRYERCAFLLLAKENRLYRFILVPRSSEWKTCMLKIRENLNGILLSYLTVQHEQSHFRQRFLAGLLLMTQSCT